MYPDPLPSDCPDRMTGVVDRVIRGRGSDDFGFICSERMSEDIYFRPRFFKGRPPSNLAKGDVVEFELEKYDEEGGTRFVAKRIQRIERRRLLDDACQEQVNLHPQTENIFQWAYLNHLPDTLRRLADLALPGERWDFENAPLNPDKPLPILRSYLFHTFGRLVYEGGKIMINEDRGMAAFNTGLVDKRYRRIYALFSRNHDPRCPWILCDFCTSGEGVGKDIVAFFDPRPPEAHYFDEPAELFYDVRQGVPDLDWDHIMIDNINRFPSEFLEDNWPSGFQGKDTSLMSPALRDNYYLELGRAIKDDNRAYRRMMSHVRDALKVSVKRIRWNFKTAIPQYYPRSHSLQLLLPLCLAEDDVVDLALAVERTESGAYLAHTVLPLDWAYNNARLICRPDSDWLAPTKIVSTGEDGELDSV